MDLDLSPALAILRREMPALAGVYLFGSHASGQARAESDIDLAFFASETVAPERVQAAREAIALALRREVDLIDLNAASTILQMQVLGEGRLILETDAAALGAFELRVLRDYPDLKFRRAAIEADIVRRGRVHA
jgi:predicted nucleotidyltransferase